MTDNPEVIIEQLKAKFNIQTDVELARKLRIEKSTVSSWKSRGRVPDRFLRILMGESHQAIAAPPIGWGEEEKAAFSLALFRFSRAFANTVEQGEYRSLIQLFTPESGHFWWLMSESQKDLIERQVQSGVSVAVAHSLVIYDDLAEGSDAIERTRTGPASSTFVDE